MTRGWSCVKAVVLASILLGIGVGSNEAQVVRTGARPVSTPRPAFSYPPGDYDDYMTLTISAGAVNFAFASGQATNPGSTAVTATLSWVCPCDTPSFEVYAYFSDRLAALTDGAGDNIPSSAFSISDNGGPFRPLTNTQPFGGANAGLHLVSIPFLGAPRGTHTDVLNFNVNLSTGTLPSLPPGTYTGTLTIQGQAI